MRSLVPLMLILMLAAVPRAAAATDAETKLQVLIGIWKKQVAASKHTPQEIKGILGDDGLKKFFDLGAKLELSSIEDNVGQMVVEAGETKEVWQAAKDYLAAARAEQAVNAAKLEAEMVALEKKVGEDCLAASHPHDLDSTLAMLRNLEHKIPDQGPPSSLEKTRVQAVIFFVEHWHKYLESKDLGDLNQADQQLHDLAGLMEVAVVPRSKILALLPSAATVDNQTGTFITALAMVEKMESLAQLPDTVARIRQLHDTQLDGAYHEGSERAPDLSSHGAPERGSKTDRSVDSLLTTLNGLLSAYHAVQSGLTAGKLLTEDRSPYVFPEDDRRITEAARSSVANLNRELTLLTLATYLKVPVTLNPKTAERPNEYLDRVTATAATSGNWALAQTTLDLWKRRYPDKAAPAWLTPEITACKIQVVAQKLEQAEDYPDALGLNLRLMRLVSRYVSPEAVARKINELRAAHPEANDQAVKIAGSESMVRTLLN